MQKLNLGYVTIDTEVDAQFDVYLGLKEKLVPIIFQHGLGASITLHSQHLRELASHGYVIFCPESIAGCSIYTELKDGKPILYDRSVDNWELKNK